MDRARGHTPIRVDSKRVGYKAIRGAQMQGNATHLICLMTHDHGVVVAQQNVHEQTNEILVARDLLWQRDLTGWVVTADAMHTQRATIQTITEQGGQYLLIVKDNQPELETAVREWMTAPAWAEEHEVVELKMVFFKNGILYMYTLPHTILQDSLPLLGLLYRYHLINSRGALLLLASSALLISIGIDEMTSDGV